MNKRIKIFISPYQVLQAAVDLESQVNSFLANTPNVSVIDVQYQSSPSISTVLLLYATTETTN